MDTTPYTYKTGPQQQWKQVREKVEEKYVHVFLITFSV